MKKALVCLLLILVLSCANANAATYSPSDDSFSVTYPDDWKVDTTLYSAQSTDTAMWLCNFVSMKTTIELSMYDYSNVYGKLNLFSCTTAEMSRYKADIDASYEGSGETAQYLETLFVRYQDAAIPFLLYQVTGGANGDYYYADTMANGWTIAFFSYSTLDGVMREQNLTDLKDILNTFTPMVTV